MRFLRLLESAPRMIERLGWDLVSCKMILLAVMSGRDPVRVRGFLV